MALISCSECGKKVSENADSCPHCGDPIAAKPPATANVKVARALKKWEGIGFVLMAIGIVMVIIHEQMTNEDITKAGVIGGYLLLAGSIVFLIGRFK